MPSPLTEAPTWRDSDSPPINLYGHGTRVSFEPVDGVDTARMAGAPTKHA